MNDHDNQAETLAAAFKAAMRRLVATVTIVTNRDPADGNRLGMTATAVTSLSVDPPSLLVCVNRSATMHPTLALGSRFCVNILGSPHADLARNFGGGVDPELRFEAGEWRDDPDGVPFLADAVATVFCRVDQLIDYATHSIVIGRVEGADADATHRSLIYGNGKFALMEETA
jgi:flavin reductase (DIM6/NTAB) family NADH-FMN oxidoreductase RutF